MDVLYDYAGYVFWDAGVNVDRRNYYLCVCVNRKDMRIENWLICYRVILADFPARQPCLILLFCL